MTLVFQDIEFFFGAQLEFVDITHGKFERFMVFDGFVYWTVLCNRETCFIRISAQQEPFDAVFPIFEIAGHFSNTAVKPISGGGTALVLQPHDISDTENFLVITKTEDKRLSLSTCLGVGPSKSESK
jgi:hypothetical protein